MSRIIVALLFIISAAMSVNIDAYAKDPSLTDVYSKAIKGKKRYKKTNISSLFSLKVPEKVRNAHVSFTAVYSGTYPAGEKESFKAFLVSEFIGDTPRPILIEASKYAYLGKLKPGDKIRIYGYSHYTPKTSKAKKFGMQLLSSAVSGLAQTAQSKTDNKLGDQGIAMGGDMLQGALPGVKESSSLVVFAIKFVRPKAKPIPEKRVSFFHHYDMAILKAIPKPEPKKDKKKRKKHKGKQAKGLKLGGLSLEVTPVSNTADIFATLVSKRSDKQIEKMMLPLFNESGSVPIYLLSITNNTRRIIDFSDLVVNYVPRGGNPKWPVGYKNLIAGDGADDDPVIKQLLEYASENDLQPFDSKFKLIPGYSYSGYLFFDYDLSCGPDEGELVLFLNNDQGTKKKKKRGPSVVKIPFEVVKGNGLKIGAYGNKVYCWEKKFFKKKKSKSKRTIAQKTAKDTRNTQDTSGNTMPKEQAVQPDNCKDGLDNDKDGWVDAKDPDCVMGRPETNFSNYKCNDNVDNDLDFSTDADDPDCKTGASDAETPK